MIRTWQRKGSVSCLNPLQVKHSRIYWFQMLCSYNVQRDYSFSIKKFFFFFFLPESQFGPESTVADMVGECHPVPGVWWTPHHPAHRGAEALQAARKVPSCPAGTMAPGIACKANLNLPPGCLAQGSIPARSVWTPAPSHHPSPLPVCKSCIGLTSLPLIPSHESAHSS